MNPFKIYLYDKKNRKEISSNDITLETNLHDLQVLLKHFDKKTNKEYVLGDVYYNKFENEFYIFSLLREDAINYRTNSFEESGVSSFGFVLCKNNKDKFINKKEFLSKYQNEMNYSNYIGNVFREDVQYINKNMIDVSTTIKLTIANMNESILFKVNGQHYNVSLKSLRTFTGDAMVLKKIINEPFTFDIVIKFKSAIGDIVKTVEYNGSLFKLQKLDDINFINEDIRTVRLSQENIKELKSFYNEVFVFLNDDGGISFLSASSIPSNQRIKGYPILSYSALMRSDYKVIDYVRHMDESYMNSILRAL